jgi:hypothetical protein
MIFSKMDGLDFSRLKVPVDNAHGHFHTVHVRITKLRGMGKNALNHCIPDQAAQASSSKDPEFFGATSSRAMY